MSTTKEKFANKHPNTSTWNEDERTEYMKLSMPLIISAVNRFHVSDPAISKEDLIQEAQIAFWHAYDTYNPNKEMAFTSYAYDLMKKHLLYRVRDYNAKKRKPPQPLLSLDSAMDEDSYSGYDSLNIPDTIADLDANPTEDDAIHKEIASVIYKLLEHYDKDSRFVFLNLALKTKTQKELAEEMHCSQGKISMMYALVRVQLRYDLSKLGYDAKFV